MACNTNWLCAVNDRSWRTWWMHCVLRAVVWKRVFRNTVIERQMALIVLLRSCTFTRFIYSCVVYSLARSDMQQALAWPLFRSWKWYFSIWCSFVIPHLLKKNTTLMQFYLQYSCWKWYSVAFTWTKNKSLLEKKTTILRWMPFSRKVVCIVTWCSEAGSSWKFVSSVTASWQTSIQFILRPIWHPAALFLYGTAEIVAIVQHYTWAHPGTNGGTRQDVKHIERGQVSLSQKS